MHFLSLALPLALASVTLAVPTASWAPIYEEDCATGVAVAAGAPGSAPPKHVVDLVLPEFCLTHEDAQHIIDGFVNMLENTQENFNYTLAEELLADDFSDYSDSINYLKRTPLGEVSFATKADFIKGQGTQPPFPSVDTLNMFHTCTSIAWRWQGNYTPLWIRGVNMFFINNKKQIQTVLVEMNSGAFLKNVGKPECNASIAYYQ